MPVATGTAIRVSRGAGASALLSMGPLKFVKFGSHLGMTTVVEEPQLLSDGDLHCICHPRDGLQPDVKHQGTATATSFVGPTRYPIRSPRRGIAFLVQVARGSTKVSRIRQTQCRRSKLCTGINPYVPAMRALQEKSAIAIRGLVWVSRMMPRAARTSDGPAITNPTGSFPASHAPATRAVVSPCRMGRRW